MKCFIKKKIRLTEHFYKRKTQKKKKIVKA